MESKIGEAVIYPGDLNSEFSVENVEQMSVFSVSRLKFENCEDWSSNDEDLCLSVGDFNVIISSGKCLFIYGEPIIYGFFNRNRRKLVFLPSGTSRLPAGFTKVGKEFLDVEYPIPKTMLDFGNSIDNYMFRTSGRKLELQNDFTRALDIMPRPPETPVQPDSDLPF